MGRNGKTSDKGGRANGGHRNRHAGTGRGNARFHGPATGGLPRKDPLPGMEILRNEFEDKSNYPTWYWYPTACIMMQEIWSGGIILENI